jgi:hypothetical protein
MRSKPSGNFRSARQNEAARAADAAREEETGKKKNFLDDLFAPGK